MSAPFHQDGVSFLLMKMIGVMKDWCMIVSPTSGTTHSTLICLPLTFFMFFVYLLFRLQNKHCYVFLVVYEWQNDQLTTAFYMLFSMPLSKLPPSLKETLLRIVIDVISCKQRSLVTKELEYNIATPSECL